MQRSKEDDLRRRKAKAIGAGGAGRFRGTSLPVPVKKGLLHSFVPVLTREVKAASHDW